MRTIKASLSLCILFLIVILSVTSISSCNDDCKKDYARWKENYEKEKKLKVTDLPLAVYIENSGSIDGYVNDMGIFKTDIYAMISNSVVTEAKLNFINSEILPQNTTARDFILNLTPATFKQLGGNRSSSDIAAVIEESTKGANKIPTILVSDFIFSPDKSHRDDPKGYLELQKNDIKNITAKQLKQNNNLAVVVLKGLSNFNGTYYNRLEQPITINGERPFYVLVVGPRPQLALLLNETKATTHFKNAYAEFAATPINYGILPDKRYKVGNFRPCKNSKIHIEKIEGEHRSSAFEFCVGADFSNMPLNDAYLTNPENYKLSDSSYKIKSIKTISDKNSDYTHIITLASTNKSPKPSNLEVTMIKNFPQWIEQSNDPDGMTAAEGKTFGIQPMLEGIHLAFKDPKNSKDYYTTFKLFIEK